MFFWIFALSHNEWARESNVISLTLQFRYYARTLESHSTWTILSLNNQLTDNMWIEVLRSHHTKFISKMHTNGEPMQAYIPNFIFAQSNSFRFALKTSGSDNLWVSIFPAISRSMILCLCTAETPPNSTKSSHYWPILPHLQYPQQSDTPIKTARSDISRHTARLLHNIEGNYNKKDNFPSTNEYCIGAFFFTCSH